MEFCEVQLSSYHFSSKVFKVTHYTLKPFVRSNTLIIFQFGSQIFFKGIIILKHTFQVCQNITIGHTSKVCQNFLKGIMIIKTQDCEPLKRY